MSDPEPDTKQKKDNRKFVRIAFKNDEEKKIFEEVKKWFGVEHDSEVLRILIKRAYEELVKEKGKLFKN